MVVYPFRRCQSHGSRIAELGTYGPEIANNITIDRASGFNGDVSAGSAKFTTQVPKLFKDHGFATGNHDVLGRPSQGIFKDSVGGPSISLWFPRSIPCVAKPTPQIAAAGTDENAGSPCESPFSLDAVKNLRDANHAGKLHYQVSYKTSEYVDSILLESSLTTTHGEFALPGTPFQDQLECFENSFPDREYWIEIKCPEFTSMCPKTGQPDFGTLIFKYVPDKKCVELKSLKLYLQKFRSEGIFYENITNRILDDFVTMVSPRRVTLESHWSPRGGISSVITVQYEKTT